MARSRRGRGESGVRYRKPIAARNGRQARAGIWIATVSEGIDKKSGRRIRKDFYAASKQDAIAKLLKYQVEHGGSKARVSERTALADYLLRWLDEARASKSANTARRYEQLIELHVIPHVGKIRLDAFGTSDAERLLRDLREAKASSSTLAKVYAVLRNALNAAKRRGLIIASPLEAVNAPRYRRPPVTSLTVKQVSALLKAAQGHRQQYVNN